jgi:hypothetical protein
MESILDQISNGMLWGSFGVLIWGAVLSIGQIFSEWPPRDPRPARRAEDARRRRLASGLLTALLAVLVAVLLVLPTTAAAQGDVDRLEAAIGE